MTWKEIVIGIFFAANFSGRRKNAKDKTTTDSGNESLNTKPCKGEIIIVAGTQSSGTYMVIWDGRDESGEKVSPGIYFYRLKMGNFSSTWMENLMRASMLLSSMRPDRSGWQAASTSSGLRLDNFLKPERRF